mgnify:CR=1 FL=1
MWPLLYKYINANKLSYIANECELKSSSLVLQHHLSVLLFVLILISWEKILIGISDLSLQIKSRDLARLSSITSFQLDSLSENVKTQV